MRAERASKFKCDHCGEISLETDILSAPSPFREDDSVIACPVCRYICGFDEICDRDGCESSASSGTPMKNGLPTFSGDPDCDDYLRLCHKHWSELYPKEE